MGLTADHAERLSSRLRMEHDTTDESRWSGWMAAAQRGDQSSYARLLDELGRVIAAYLRSRFGPVEFLEDCVQECLMSIHAARHTYDARRPFRPWLFAIVRHKTIDMLRSRQAYTSMLVEQAEAHDAYSPPIDAEIETGQLLEALAPKYSQALTLTKIVGLSIAESAGRLGISESAMKVRVHRGLGAMRKLLEHETA
jgi:RNA polymerase sigma-70 factor (ECF subfamily)